MNTKEAINFMTENILDFKERTSDDELFDRDKCNKFLKKANNIVALLQRGEKFEKIVYEINNERLFGEYDGVYDIPSNSPKNIYKKIKEIIQKYFPKE